MIVRRWNSWQSRISGAHNLSYGDVLGNILTTKNLYVGGFEICTQARPLNLYGQGRNNLYLAAVHLPRLSLAWLSSSFHLIPQLLIRSTTCSHMFQALPPPSVHDRPRAADQACSYHRQEAYEARSTLTVIHLLPFESSMESRVRAPRHG